MRRPAGHEYFIAESTPIVQVTVKRVRVESVSEVNGALRSRGCHSRLPACPLQASAPIYMVSLSVLVFLSCYEAPERLPNSRKLIWNLLCSLRAPLSILLLRNIMD